MTLKKKKKKKNFFGREAFYGRSDVDNQTIYFFWPKSYPIAKVYPESLTEPSFFLVFIYFLWLRTPSVVIFIRDS